MDEASGYRVETLDVGFPTVREQTSALPTRDGDLDYTRLYGPRAVTVTGNFVPAVDGSSRQKALQGLVWWCQPRLRPRLVYAVDADCAPLWLGIRGSQLASPVVQPAGVAVHRVVGGARPDRPGARPVERRPINVGATAHRHRRRHVPGVAGARHLRAVRRPGRRRG
jgi:hypothetical protein